MSKSGKVYCDVSMQFTQKDQRLKSEVKFYIKENNEIRPYFLSNPIYIDEKEMEKKFIANKGVYYVSEISSAKNEIEISFENINKKKYQESFNITPPVWDSVQHNTNLSIKELKNWKSNLGSHWILLDSNKKLHDSYQINTDISTGNGQLVLVDTYLDEFSLDKNLFMKINLKTLSKTKEVDIQP